jgi:Fe2+ transport system protein FeoA
MNGTRGVSLGEVREGTRGVVRELAGGPGFTSRLAALGLVKGTRFDMLQNRGRGPVLVLVRDTRIALGRAEAQKILVQELVDEHGGGSGPTGRG